MAVPSRDTSPEAAEVQFRIWRSWTPEQRLASACELSASVRRLAEQAIRRQHPEASDAHVQVRLLRRLYGRDLARQIALRLNVTVDD